MRRIQDVKVAFNRIISFFKILFGWVNALRTPHNGNALKFLKYLTLSRNFKSQPEEAMPTPLQTPWQDIIQLHYPLFKNVSIFILCIS